MSLPRDLDLTTLSETYLLAMLDDQRKQDNEDARQINEIQVRRATRDEMRGKLRVELDRRSQWRWYLVKYVVGDNEYKDTYRVPVSITDTNDIGNYLTQILKEQFPHFSHVRTFYDAER